MCCWLIEKYCSTNKIILEKSSSLGGSNMIDNKIDKNNQFKLLNCPHRSLTFGGKDTLNCSLYKIVFYISINKQLSIIQQSLFFMMWLCWYVYVYPIKLAPHFRNLAYLNVQWNKRLAHFLIFQLIKIRNLKTQ